MKTSSKTYIMVSLAALSVFPLMSCGHKEEEKVVEHKELPAEVKPVAEAIIDDSPQKLAAATSFPIERPYPIPNIMDSSQLVSYYPVLIDDSLKNTIRSSADSLWHSEGWRGWTLNEKALLWIDEGTLYAIDYVSKKEHHLLDSLRHEEIATLEPNMQGGWIPVACMVDTVGGAVFRIDTDTLISTNAYRIAGYSRDAELSGTPTILLYGDLELEGTINSRIYHFNDSIGNSATYTPDVAEDDSVPAVELTRKGETRQYYVIPAYWLELNKVKGRHHGGPRMMKDNGSGKAHKDVNKDRGNRSDSVVAN